MSSKDVYRWALIKYTKLNDARGDSKEVKSSFSLHLQLIISTSRRSMIIVANQQTLEELSFIGPGCPSAKIKEADVYFEAECPALSGLIKFRVKFSPTTTRSDIQERIACIDMLRHFIIVREINLQSNNRDLSKHRFAPSSQNDMSFSQPPQFQSFSQIQDRPQFDVCQPSTMSSFSQSTNQSSRDLWSLEQTSLSQSQRVPDIFDDSSQGTRDRTFVPSIADTLWGLSSSTNSTLDMSQLFGIDKRIQTQNVDTQTEWRRNLTDAQTQTHSIPLPTSDELKDLIRISLSDPKFPTFANLVSSVVLTMHNQSDF